MKSTVFVGDIGTEIILDCGADLTSVTNCSIKVITPNKKARTWSATVTGTSTITHVVQAGDLDQAGVWVLQAYIEMPEWSGRGTTAELTVEK